jgi:hypothetical protein
MLTILISPAHPVNIKPDPAPSVGLPLPSWLSGAAGPSIASSSNNTPAGQVPHRDFGMSPHRRASDSHSHARALSAINARNNSISAGPSSITGSGIGQTASERWAGTIRNQMRHIERDGLRGAFWNRRTLGPNATAGQSYLAKTWDRIRRIPELLLVEYEDPVEPSSRIPQICLMKMEKLQPGQESFHVDHARSQEISKKHIVCLTAHVVHLESAEQLWYC